MPTAASQPRQLERGEISRHMRPPFPLPGSPCDRCQSITKSRGAGRCCAAPRWRGKFGAIKKGGSEESPRCLQQVARLLMLAAPSKVHGIGKGTSTNQHCGNPCSGHKNLLEIYTLPASVPSPIAIAHKLFWYSPIRIEPALIFSSQSAILFIQPSGK